MDVFEAMSTCRAMRYLKPDPVDDELIEQIITAATWAPSPGNSQGRDFIVVKDADKKRRIGDAIEAVMAGPVAAMERPDRTHRLMLDGTAHLIETLKTCPVLIVVCGKTVYPYAAPARIVRLVVDLPGGAEPHRRRTGPRPRHRVHHLPGRRRADDPRHARRFPTTSTSAASSRSAGPTGSSGPSDGSATTRSSTSTGGRATCAPTRRPTDD